MKKNLFYTTLIKRENVLKARILIYFLMIASYPRLFIEVIIRKNFGERYFTMASALTVMFLAGIGPIIILSITVRSIGFSAYPWLIFLGTNLTLYLYLYYFFRAACSRRDEIIRNPSVYDFAKFSLYSGDVDPKFYRYKIPGRETNIRTIEIFIEPAPFLAAGCALAIFGQILGFILIASSLVYSLSYAASYYIGDNIIMDKIDEMICNEELENAFVLDKDPEETRYFRTYARKPNDPELRRRVVEMGMDEEPVAQAR